MHPLKTSTLSVILFIFFYPVKGEKKIVHFPFEIRVSDTCYSCLFETSEILNQFLNKLFLLYGLHSFNQQYLLSTHYMPGVFLGVWDTISEQKKGYHSKLEKKKREREREVSWMSKGLGERDWWDIQ